MPCDRQLPPGHSRPPRPPLLSACTRSSSHPPPVRAAGRGPIPADLVIQLSQDDNREVRLALAEQLKARAPTHPPLSGQPRLTRAAAASQGLAASAEELPDRQWAEMAVSLLDAALALVEDDVEQARAPPAARSPPLPRAPPPPRATPPTPAAARRW